MPFSRFLEMSGCSWRDLRFVAFIDSSALVFEPSNKLVADGLMRDGLIAQVLLPVRGLLMRSACAVDTEVGLGC